MSTLTEFTNMFGRGGPVRNPINPAAIDKILGELKPQIAVLQMMSSPISVTLSTIPVLVTKFSLAKNHNTELIGSAMTDDITVNSRDGLLVQIEATAQVEMTADTYVILEIYVDGTPTGIAVRLFISGDGVNTLTGVLNVFFPQGSVITFYAYSPANETNGILRSIQIVAQKIPLGVNTPITTVEEIETELIFITNTDGSQIYNSDGDPITT